MTTKQNPPSYKLGYQRGVADTEARYAPLVEAAKAIKRRDFGMTLPTDSAKPLDDLLDALAELEASK